MATVSDITTTPLSGLNHIDALLDTGPDWNYLTPAGNTLVYTFSIASGTEAEFAGKQQAMSATQQANARLAFAYLSQVTGIQFVETTDGAAAQLHLCDMDIADASTTGLCSWGSTYSRDTGTDNLVAYSANAYVYLDNVEWAGRNATLAKGTDGYETLLHELGHALGLKHPFDGTINLPASTDNTAYTLMSYDDVGAPHSIYSQYDIAALNWLYGGDGLRGALGINSVTGGRYITGTSVADTLVGTAANDALEGDGGNDALDGGAGNDTAVFTGVKANYTFALSGGDIVVTSVAEGKDVLHAIEVLKFSDVTVDASSLFLGTVINGTTGDDILTATAGNNNIDGKQGLDVVVFGGARAGFTIERDGSNVDVTDNAGLGGRDVLTNVERLKFSDANIAIDIDGAGGRAYRLYQAAFDRKPDLGGLGFWIRAMDGGQSVAGAAAGFVTSQEFLKLYGANSSDQTFITLLYNNVLHRTPDQAGLDYWIGTLTVNHQTRAEVLAYFSESAENQAQVIGSIQNGFAYTPYGG